MSAYCGASSNWCKAKPTVRNSAKISKPSNNQPRFEATSTFHCARLSDRYQGEDTIAALVFMPVTSLFWICPVPTMRRAMFVVTKGEYTLVPRTYNISVCYLEPLH